MANRKMNKKGANPNTIWIVSIILILIVGYVLFKPNINFTSRFTAYSTTRTCASWLANEGLPSNTIVPFNWQYTSSQVRCVTSMTDTANGCSMNYEAGACTTAPGNCFTASDLDSSGKMTRTVLGKAIQCWVSGQ